MPRMAVSIDGGCFRGIFGNHDRCRSNHRRAKRSCNDSVPSRAPNKNEDPRRNEFSNPLRTQFHRGSCLQISRQILRKYVDSCCIVLLQAYCIRDLQRKSRMVIRTCDIHQISSETLSFRCASYSIEYLMISGNSLFYCKTACRRSG